MTMPMECKVANVKGDLVKFIEMLAKDYQVPPILMSGLLSEILLDWKNRELIQLNDNYNEILKTINEQLKKGDEKEDVHD